MKRRDVLALPLLPLVPAISEGPAPVELSSRRFEIVVELSSNLLRGEREYLVREIRDAIERSAGSTFEQEWDGSDAD